MTSQGIYYLIRALVALVAIPFHEAGTNGKGSTAAMMASCLQGAATRWRHGCWATTPQSGRGGFR